MKDSEIDKISALTVALIGKQFDRDNAKIIIAALEAGVGHKADVEELLAPPEMAEIEDYVEPEPVIVAAPVSKGFFSRGSK